MNIVIVTDTYLPKIDGVAVSVNNFTRLLSSPEKGHEFLILSPRYSGTKEEESPSPGIRILRFKSAPLPSYPDIKVVLPSYKKIRRAMKDFKPDLVHIQTPGLLGHYGALAARAHGVPVIGTYHTLVSEQDTYISFYRLLRVDKLFNYFNKSRKIRKRLDTIERKKAKTYKKKIILNLANRLYELGEMVISPSHLIKGELEKYGIRRPVEVVSNGLDLNKFHGSPRKAPGESPRLLHVGRLSYEKNCHIVLKAFALILHKIPGATLDIVGDGPALGSLRLEAEQLGLSDRVKFPGFVPYDTLPSLYPGYDLFVTASTMETQGLVVLEAAASGLPCIGVEAYALPELIQHGRNGFVSQPFDHIQLADNTLKVLEDPDLYEKFSRESISIAGEHDLNRCADRLEEVYTNVVQGKYRQSEGSSMEMESRLR